MNNVKTLKKNSLWP